MRIRTIKPEFWSHPVMVRQSDAAKLLALGLLNYADDEGYFYAEPSLVRAALRPLDEDSKIVDSALNELKAIGYIDLFDHVSHGKLGRIVAFTLHQRVDKPRDSNIRVLWGKTSSKSNRRTIVDQSALYGKGREGKGKDIRASFDSFWKIYPKRKARLQAIKAFEKADVPIETLLVAVQAAILSEDWRKDGGKFIPHAATWLNGRRWEDELAATLPPASPPLGQAVPYVAPSSI